eukprot:5578054-Alexandrium_andersonii.AAC.1
MVLGAPGSQHEDELVGVRQALPRHQRGFGAEVRAQIHALLMHGLLMGERPDRRQRRRQGRGCGRHVREGRLPGGVAQHVDLLLNVE